MTRYLKLWDWGAGYNVLKGDLYHCHEDKDELQRNDFNLHYFAGTDLNFIFWVEGKETGSNLTLRGADYREGEKMGFNSAKINVPSSYHVNFSFDPKFPWYCAGGNKATGSLTTAVPVPPEIIIPPLANRGHIERG